MLIATNTKLCEQNIYIFENIDQSAMEQTLFFKEGVNNWENRKLINLTPLLILGMSLCVYINYKIYYKYTINFDLMTFCIIFK